MRIVAIFILLLGLSLNSYGNETIKTDKIDSTKSKQTINEYRDIWAKFEKEDPNSNYEYITKKFDTNYILHIFYSPAVGGNILIFVSNLLLEERQ